MDIWIELEKFALELVDVRDERPLLRNERAFVRDERAFGKQTFNRKFTWYNNYRGDVLLLEDHNPQITHTDKHWQR